VHPGAIAHSARACLLALVIVLVWAARADAAAPAEFFGVAPAQSIDESDAAQMAAAGVGTVRIGIWWTAVQPAPGAGYDWETTDAIVAMAARNGMSVLPYLLGAPEWATGPTNSPPVDSEVARAGWRAFVLAAVHRYGAGGSFWIENPGVPLRPFTAWEIWNEENSPGYWGERRRPSPREYAVVLNLASSAIREADPAGQVIVGGLNVGGGINPRRFLGRLYEIPGARRSFDGVSLHPYAATPRDALRQLRAGRAVLTKHGDDEKGIWVTEIGWTSGGAGADVDSSLTGQAMKLQRSFALMARERRELDLERVIWFTWQDDPATPVCSWCANAGLLDSTGAPKPALRNFMGFTH
jgi:polysaccharide biosynthesis protein PslG